MRSAALLLAGVALGAVGCRTPAAPPAQAPLVGTDVRFAPIVPDAVDHAAADLAGAVLAGSPGETASALVAFRRAREEAGAETGLDAVAQDAANAALQPGRPWRDATAALLERDDLEPALRERLERELRDDPLALAEARLRDARVVGFADFFNALAEPVGRSLLRPVLAPYLLGRSLAHYTLDVLREDPLPLRDRQALAHWKTFRERYPTSEEARVLAPRVGRFQERLSRTQHDRALERAERALDEGRARAALLYAQRALRYRKSRAAAETAERAQALIAARRAAVERATGFAPLDPAEPLRDGERESVLALLSGAPLGEPRELRPDDPLGPERRYLGALALGEAGRDPEMWQALEALEEDGPPRMARHAATARLDPVRNPYGAFRRARAQQRRSEVVWVLLGPLAQRPEESVTGMLQYLIDLPARIQAAALLPIRLLTFPWRAPSDGNSLAAVHARRYLAQHPRGARAPELRDWLEGYERGRGNYVAALRVAEGRASPDDAELDALRERAASQALGVAEAEARRDLRARLLLHVAKTFPETRAGRDAGARAREEARESTPHRIRLSRSFLLENPEVAGPAGLDLAPALLDENPRNGELHPDGVALVGGRTLEVSVLAADGDEDDPPERLLTRVSDAQLARVVARLEETSFRNALADPDDALEPDAQRDVVFERARLGLADTVDTRATAEARYAYRGMRERYGMVRGREGILPFDLVVQGSLADFTLGAFPRMKKPHETPDALLYR